MRDFVNQEALIFAAEAEVREEARRHPDDPWTPDRDKHIAEYSVKNHPVEVAAPAFVAAISDARKRLRNECLAERLEQVRKAATVRDDYQLRGWPLPLWVKNTLDWAAEPEKITSLYDLDNDEEENLDEAITAISRALA